MTKLNAFLQVCNFLSLKEETEILRQGWVYKHFATHIEMKGHLTSVKNHFVLIKFNRPKLKISFNLHDSFLMLKRYKYKLHKINLSPMPNNSLCVWLFTTIPNTFVSYESHELAKTWDPGDISPSLFSNQEEIKVGALKVAVDKNKKIKQKRSESKWQSKIKSGQLKIKLNLPLFVSPPPIFLSAPSPQLLSSFV